MAHGLAQKQNAQVTPLDQGMVARVKAGVKYIIRGVGPESWFGPAEPIAPISQESQGRTFEYPVGYNLQQKPKSYDPVSFEQMRSLADNYDLLRLVIEANKDQLPKMKWRIREKDEDKKKTSKKDDPRIKEITDFMAYPDKENDFNSWLRMLMEDMLVIDAPTIYPRKTKGGKLYSLEVMDGATITRKINADGRTPVPPDPAYQQYIHGVSMANYSADELIYKPRNVRSNRLYGYSPVEQIIMTVNIALRRQVFQLNFYKEGNIPEALCGVPDSWTVDQVSAFQAYWDSLMEGNLAERRKMRFVPGELAKNYKQIKPETLKDEMDEWLARVVCYAFSINPQAFVKQMNRATSETAQEIAIQEGLEPRLIWIKAVVDYIIFKYFGYPDLEFTWEEQEDQSPDVQAKVNDLKIRNGSMTIDEARFTDGKEPLPNGLGAKPLIYTGQGVQLLEDVINPPEPSSAPPPVPGKGGEATPPAVVNEEEKDKTPDVEKLEKAKARKRKTLKSINRNRTLVKKARKSLKAALLPLFDKAKKAAKKITIPVKKAADEEIEAQIQAILDQLALEDWVMLIDPSEEILEGVTKDGVYQALLQIGFNGADVTDVMSAKALEYAQTRAAELVTQISEATRDMLRSDITHALEEGWSANKLGDAISENYAFSDERAETIARTEITNADIQGNMMTYKESGVVEGKEWVLGSEHDDDDECDDNADAGVIPLDEEFPSGDTEPLAHPRCLIGETIISAGGVSKSFKRWFEGEIIILSVAGMDDVSITPNHPILTRRGWIAAGELTELDDLVYCSDPRALISIIYPDNNHIETSIENVTGSLLMSGGMSSVGMKTSPEDFHGDGIIDGEVEIISAASELRDDNKSRSGQNIKKLEFVGTALGRMILNADCTAAELLKTLLLSPDSLMSGGGVSASLCGSHASRTGTFGITESSNRQSHTMKSISEGGAVTTEPLCNITSGLTSLITFVKLQDIRRTKYFGHVYNLQTKDNYYIAHNLVVSNCVCDIMPVLYEDEENKEE